jgi:hypothetical protein
LILVTGIYGWVSRMRSKSITQSQKYIETKEQYWRGLESYCGKNVFKDSEPVVSWIDPYFNKTYE